MINDTLRRINPSELRTIQVNILKYFVEMCNKNSIKYYMTYGSLIGVIRHKGFIPWDDDIDVMVLRKDVEKLKKVFNGPKYKVINTSVNKKYFSPLLKVYDNDTLLIQDYGQVEGMNIGVYIDVFVLDNVPRDEKRRKIFYKKAQRLRFLWALSCRKFSAKSRNFIISFLKSVISIPFKLIGYSFFSKKYESYASSYKNEGCYGIVVYSEGYNKEYVYSERDLETISMPFENLEVFVSISYDKALKKCYGDYMIIPPIEEREIHLFNAFYRDTKL